MTENTRIKITNPTITIQNGPGGANDKKKYLKIAFGNAGDILAWNDGLSGGNGANIVMNNNTNHFKTGAAAANKRPDTLTAVWIKFDDEKTAQRYARLAKLRNLFQTEAAAGVVKGAGQAQEDTWTIITKKLRYDGDNAGTTYFNDEDAIGLINANDLKLNSKVDGTGSYVSGATRNDILCIDDENWTDNTSADTNVFSYKKTVDEYWNLCDLHDEIEEMLRGDINIDKGKIDGWLGKIREFADNTKVDKYRVYDADFGGVVGGSFNFGGQFLKDTTDNYHKLLWEFKLWKDCGLNNAKEVLKANANGFIINTRGGAAVTIGDGNVEEKDMTNADHAVSQANVVAIKKVIKNGLYKGFKMIGADQNDATVTPTNANKQLLGKEVGPSTTNTNFPGDKDTIYGKLAIDNFRTVWKKTNQDDWGGKGNFRGFYPIANATYSNAAATNRAADEDANSATYTSGTTASRNIFDDTDTNKISGRKDGDPAELAKTPPVVDSTGYKLKELTKTCFDILVENTPANVLNLLFRSDFDGVGIGEKQAVLDKYWFCIQSNRANNNYATNPGTLAAPENNFKEYKLAYEELTNFLTYFDVDYSSYNKSQGSTLNTAKTKLEEYLVADNTNPNKQRIRDFWQYGSLPGGSKRDEIRKKIKQIDAALGKNAPDNNTIKAKDITDARDALTLTCEDSVKEEIKKMFDTPNHATIIAGGQALLDKVKELAILINKAFKDGKNTTKSEFDAFKGATSGNEAEAWKLAEAIKSNNEGLGTRALAKAVKKNDETLEETKTRIKGELEKVVTGAGVIIDNATTLTDKSKIEMVLTILKECKEAWGKKKEDSGISDLKNKLSGYSSEGDSDKEKIAWKAINEHFKKNGTVKDSTDGYAAGALKHLESIDKKVEDEIDKSKITTVGNEADADKAIKILEESTASKIRDIVLPRAKLIKALFKKGDNKSKALVKLVQEFLKKTEEDYTDDSHATNLDNLKKKLEELKKYKDGENSEVYKSLGTEEKKTFDAFLTRLEKKVNAMETLAKKGNEKQEKPNDSFWKGWKGITLIIVIVLVVVGGIAWLIKANSSEEGEGEIE